MRRRLFSAVSMPTNCLRLASIPCKARISASGRGLGAGRTTSAKRARTSASILSVLASLPIALAKSLAWRGLTTATGKPSAAKAATTARLKLPVASRITVTGRSWRRRETKVSIPASSWETTKASSCLWASPRRTQTSSCSLETAHPHLNSSRRHGVQKLPPLAVSFGPSLRIRAPLVF
jgi:hypothetical protein